MVNNPKCPECRADFTVTDKPVPDIAKQELVTAFKELWAVTNGPNKAKAPQSWDNNNNNQKIETKAPENHDLLSWGDQVKMVKKNANIVEDAFKPVADFMGWDKIFFALQDEYKVAPHEWVALQGEDDSLKGICWIQHKAKLAYEVHWSGVTEDEETDYFGLLFKNVMEKIREKTMNIYEKSQKKVTASYYLPYEDEKDYQWFHRIINYANNSEGMVFDSTSADLNIKGNVLKRKRVTLYPWVVPGNRQGYKDSIKARLVSGESMKRDFERSIDIVLDDKNGPQLNNLFRITSLGNVNLANKLKVDFEKHPERFFVYTVGGKAAGYVQLSKNSSDEQLVIERLGIHPSYTQYRHNFISQFLKGVDATNVIYSSSWTKEDRNRDDLKAVAEYLELECNMEMKGNNYVVEIFVK